MSSRLSRIFYQSQRTPDGTRKVRILGIPFKFRSDMTVAEKLADREKDFIENSFLWDPVWYVSQYGYSFNRQQALEHWLNEGWKKGESPSAYLNVSYFRGDKHHKNPILRYYSRGLDRAFFPDNKNNFRARNEQEIIARYWQQQPGRKARMVIYTCITNDYDDLHDLAAYYYTNEAADYVCFTDNEADLKAGRVGIWQTRPLQYTASDTTRNNRWHKTHPHLLFPEYEESLYIDSNINILTDYLFRVIQEKDAPFILPRHPKNLCIYSEYEDVLRAQLDKQELILQEREVLQQAGMPRNYGFCENNVLYRRHHAPEVISIMEEWWGMIEQYAKRDQLSLVFLLWKNGIKPADITFENTRYLINDFYVFGHKKGR